MVTFISYIQLYTVSGITCSTGEERGSARMRVS